jgi:3-mercaptopyruvate sulfurtransferase SseA
MQNRGTAGSTTPANPQTQAGPTVPPDLTATAIAFATQTRPEVLPHVTVTEAKGLFDANDAKFIDVRVKEQYAAGHIQGAVNIPYTEVGQRVAEFPRTGNVIVYCQ